MSKRASKKEMESRVAEAAELVLQGQAYSLITSHVAEKYSISRRQARRRVFAMDLVEKPNLGEKLIQLYKSQLIKLPATVLKQIAKADEVKGYAEVGKAFSKKLEKHPIWKEIVKTNSDITPYSLRHRFAHQCHTGSRYPISVTDAAEAMGHTPDVHNGSYARYTDEMSVERAFKLHNEERVTL